MSFMMENDFTFLILIYQSVAIIEVANKKGIYY